MTEARSITTKEAAKLLRQRLKCLYPATKFSVRFERYSMGSHINVAWTDGPPVRVIEAISEPYSSTRFDGMDDSSSYVKSWLLPDGSAVTAKKTDEAVPNAELVSFHGSRPHCDGRTISAKYEAVCAKAWAGLTERERGTLKAQTRFPAWEGHSDGYKMAWFFDASDIVGG